MFIKKVKAYGEDREIRCDGICSKAWGINNRPKVGFDPNEPDDVAWLADHEVGEAPTDPGTYEGGHAKPQGITDGSGMNKWCFRECERCETAPKALPDFTKRLYNQPWKHPEA